MIIPLPPKDPKDVPRYLAALVPIIQQISTDIEADSITLTITHAEPDKIEDGLIVYADGTNWNPGSGEGVYARENGAWSKK